MTVVVVGNMTIKCKLSAQLQHSVLKWAKKMCQIVSVCVRFKHIHGLARSSIIIPRTYPFPRSRFTSYSTSVQSRPWLLMDIFLSQLLVIKTDDELFYPIPFIFPLKFFLHWNSLEWCWMDFKWELLCWYCTKKHSNVIQVNRNE